MLAARIGLAGAIERSDDDEPLADVVLALSASTAAMLALIDAAAGLAPLTVIPCLAVPAGHALRLPRVALVAAAVVWLRVLGLSEATGLLTPMLMVAICAVLLVGPGRVLDWLEVRWEARAERLRLEREERQAAALRLTASTPWAGSRSCRSLAEGPRLVAPRAPSRRAPRPAARPVPPRGGMPSGNVSANARRCHAWAAWTPRELVRSSSVHAREASAHRIVSATCPTGMSVAWAQH